jgi:aryl-alcohol dehydrogenase-like predicted oxidoreductase
VPSTSSSELPEQVDERGGDLLPGAHNMDRAGGPRLVTRAPFGRTGHRSSRVIFGAASLSRSSQEHADRVLETLLELGVNHLDAAAAYGDAELRLAPWLRRHPGAFFVATKTGERTGDGARASLERSLGRLGVERVDLIQLHNLVEMDEWEVAHGPGGALDALCRARDEGLARFIGVTGHGLRIAAMHRRSLERFDYDSVLLPYNHLLLRDAEYGREVAALLATCRQRHVAVQTIKSVARRRWRERAEPAFSWYEPLPASPALERAVRFVLSDNQLFLNSSSDTRLLRPTLDAAIAAGPYPDRPPESELDADAEELDMAPLFDGRALETI